MKLNVYLYSGMQKLIEKSGVGRALYHQREAAGKKGIIIVTCLAEADILHINTVFPKSLWMAKLAKRKGIPVIYHRITSYNVCYTKLLRKLDSVLAFWVAYVFTRPLGASLGDYLSQPKKYGGLGLGTTVTSIIFLLAILTVIVILTATKMDIKAKNEAASKEPEKDTGHKVLS